MNEPSTMAAETFQLKEGKAEFSCPADLSAESRKDLSDWLKLLQRKLKRQSEHK
jgi:hypothetical protein